MLENFTDSARRVVVLAQEEGRLLGHQRVGSEHFLLGLIREGEGVAAQALERLGVRLEPVREQIRERYGRGEPAWHEQLPFTPRAKEILTLSLRESRRLGHRHIGTEHLFLAVLREGKGVAIEVLGALAVDRSRLRDEVMRMVSDDAPAPAAEPQAGAYVGLPLLGDELFERLSRHPDAEVVDLAAKLRASSDEFNRVGVNRLVEMITSWRGEVFLDAVFRDPITGAFLTQYGVPKPD